MTTEEKAKAYDKALERARNIRFGNPQSGTANIVCEQVFPELKESEDVRIKREILELVSIAGNGNQFEEIKDWLEKRGDKVTDCRNIGNPNGGIVLEDFNGGEGFIKLHLDYLTKKQVEDVEKLVRMWNREIPDDIIRACIGMCLTDADEQKFKDFNTTLRDCLDWLDNQCEGENELQRIN